MIPGDTQYMVGHINTGGPAPVFVPETGGYSDQGEWTRVFKLHASSARPRVMPGQNPHMHDA